MNFSEIEKLIENKLPGELVDFLGSLGDEMLEPSLSFPLLEPTPFGDGVVDNVFIPEIDYLKADEFFEMGMLCIGNNMMGNGVYLSFRNKDFGAIYYWDHDYRCFWDDETFYRMYPNLAPEIAEYIALRKLGKLPEKEEEYESFYLVSKSFKDFLIVAVPQEY